MQSPKQLKESAFIDKLKNNHYVICPKEILFGYENVTLQEKFAYLYLIQYGLFSIMNGHVDKDGNPIIYASQERLAKDMNVSQPTISRYCKKLEEAGLIAIYSQGNGASNYTTVFPPTYSCMNTEPIHVRIQNNRDSEKRENEKTDGYPSEGSDNKTPIALKTSKKDKARKKAQGASKKGVSEIINEITSRPPKARTQKERAPESSPKVHDRRNW